MTAFSTFDHTPVEPARAPQTDAADRYQATEDTPRIGRPPVLDTPPTPMSPQWAEVWRDFERAHSTHSDSTLSNKHTVIRQLAAWLAKPANGSITHPLDVTKKHLRDYISAQEKERQGNGSGVLILYAQLRTFFRWVGGEYNGCDECADPQTFRFHGCSANAMYGVRRPSPKKNRSKTVPVLSPAEVEALLSAVSGRDARSVRDRALITLLIESGVRRAEALALDVSDVEFERTGAVLHVRHGKNNNERWPVVGPETAAALSRWLRIHPLNDGTADWDGPLFANVTHGKNAGNRMCYQAVSAIVKRAGDAAGIDHLHPHQLRHAWADFHYRRGTPESVMRQLGGWQGKIPTTYGAGAAEERARNAGLAAPVLDGIRARNNAKGRR